MIFFHPWFPKLYLCFIMIFCIITFLKVFTPLKKILLAYLLILDFLVVVGSPSSLSSVLLLICGWLFCCLLVSRMYKVKLLCSHSYTSGVVGILIPTQEKKWYCFSFVIISSKENINWFQWYNSSINVTILSTYEMIPFGVCEGKGQSGRLNENIGYWLLFRVEIFLVDEWKLLWPVCLYYFFLYINSWYWLVHSLPLSSGLLLMKTFVPFLLTSSFAVNSLQGNCKERKTQFPLLLYSLQFKLNVVLNDVLHFSLLITCVFS